MTAMDAHTESDTRRRRVLIVDDEPPNRRLLASMLKHEGYELVHAENGRVAVDVIASEPIDVVLLDVMMPLLDGIETCKVVRQHLDKPLLPIVMITALTDHSSRLRAKQAGVDDFITKPVYKDELLARVRALLHVQCLHEAMRRQREIALADARRWRLVSRVADEVATAASFEVINARIADVLAVDLPIDEVECGFTTDPSSPASPRLLALLGAVQGISSTPRITPEGLILYPFATAGALDGGLLLKPRTMPSPVDRELFVALAPHLANAIARVRLFRANEAIAQARDRLSAMLAHDFKNPLSVIKMNLHVVRSAVTVDEDDVTGAVDDAVAASDQILRMVLDLIDINRAEGGLLPFAPRHADVGAVVRASAEPLREFVKRADAHLDIVTVDDAFASLDATLIERVVQNLLVNAARFVRPGGVVEVGVTRERDDAVITVANDGPSIPPERRAELFRKYGVVSVDAQHANRGLGLYLCSLVVERHHGTISVDDRRGGGVCFIIRLPAAPRGRPVL